VIGPGPWRYDRKLREDLNTLTLKSWDRVWKANFGREKHDAYSHFNWRNYYGRVASCDVARVDPMVSRKDLVDISGQGLCGGWKTRNSRKRSRRSPEARTAGGPTLRGWHDLLNIRPKRDELTPGVNLGVIDQTNKSLRLLLGDLGKLHCSSRPFAGPSGNDRFFAH
jgi:hypothetical protein